LLNAVLSCKGVGRKILGGKGAKGKPRPRNSSNKPTSILSVAGKRTHWACTLGLSLGNAAPRALRKK